MTTPEDPGRSRLEHVMEVYDDPDQSRENRYAGLSPVGIGIAGAIAVSHGVALLTGQYAVALALVLVTLLGVGAIVSDRFPDDPVRGWPR